MESQFSDSVSAELAYLGQLLEEFSARHPKIANRLRHGAQATSESRLVQAFAFLVSRTQRRLDAEYPTILKPLVDLVGMPGPASIPSLMTVNFQLHPDQLPEADGSVIPRGTELVSEPIDGVSARFQTCADVDLWPIQLCDSSLELPPFPSGSAADATCALKLQLRTLGSNVAFKDLAATHMRFFIHGERAHAFRLYDAIFRDAREIEFRSASGRCGRLGPDALRPTGFSNAERLLPGSDRDDARLIVEFFAYPEKFLYFELHGLNQIIPDLDESELEIYIYLRSEKEWMPRQLAHGAIRLNCAPGVNLFEEMTTPVELKSRSDRITLDVDEEHPDAFEIHSVNQVFIRDSDDQEYEIPRFHGPQRASSSAATEVSWEYDDLEQSAVRRRSARVPLRFVDNRFDATKIENSVIFASALCSNGDLPGQLASDTDGALLSAESLPLVAECRCLGSPTRLRRLALARTNWERVSQSLPDPLTIAAPNGAVRLRSALQTLTSDDDAMLHALIMSLADVRIQRSAGIVDGRMMCHGIEITLVFARASQAPCGHVLLAEVLQYFLANYVTRGVFFRLRAVYDDGKELRQWPTRSGGRSVI